MDLGKLILNKIISVEFFLLFLFVLMTTAVFPSLAQTRECESLDFLSETNTKEIEAFKKTFPEFVVDWSLLKKESFVVNGEVGVWETKTNNQIRHGFKSSAAKFRPATKSSGKVKSRHVSQDGKAAALVLDLGKTRTINCCKDEMCDVVFPTLIEGQTVVFLNLVKKEIVYIRKGLYLMESPFDSGGFGIHKSSPGPKKKICIDFEPICPITSEFKKK